MTHYILQTIAFQLLFLVVYDLFLKKETFFNLNRAYLILTPILSLTIPFIKVEQFKEIAPLDYYFTLPEVILTAKTDATNTQDLLPDLTIMQWILLIGCLMSSLLFMVKLIKILHLRQNGKIRWYADYTEVVVNKSELAFSFFKNIFLGDEVKKKNHDHIIAHELVHIKQKHSLDLIFFELLRILFWFNPLVYVYQNRISELHEFIADAKTAKTDKKEHYQLLLEEVFKTEKISFINQFFNHSLIKKRIVMLQKSRSKKVWQLKYLLLVPVVVSMLFYTSCEQTEESRETSAVKVERTPTEIIMHVKDVKNLSEREKQTKEEILEELNHSENYSKFTLTDGISSKSMKIEYSNGKISKMEVQYDNNEKNRTGEDHPFSSIPVKPSFKEPCENDENALDCFKKSMDKHIIENFRYPDEAQEKNIQGRVYINFRINTDGTVTILNTKAPDKLLEDEGRRLIETLPRLNPGKDENGNPVPVTFAYPIVFKLN